MITPRWEKTIILEIVLLLLLLICNLLLFIGAVRQKTVELLPWLVGHGVLLGVLVVLSVYYMVAIFIISTPSTQVGAFIKRMIARKLFTESVDEPASRDDK